MVEVGTIHDCCIYILDQDVSTQTLPGEVIPSGKSVFPSPARTKSYERTRNNRVILYDVMHGILRTSERVDS